MWYKNQEMYIHLNREFMVNKHKKRRCKNGREMYEMWKTPG